MALDLRRSVISTARDEPLAGSSTFLFLLKPGKIAEDQYDGPIEGSAKTGQSPGIPVVSTSEMGVDLAFPKSVTATPEEVSRFLEVDLDVQVVCIDTRTVRKVGFFMVPRSSITKTGARLINSPAVIDPGYLGSIRARFDLVRPVSFEAGDSVLQLTTPDHGGANFTIVTEGSPPEILALFDPDSTDRGSGAFGSTGSSGTTKSSLGGAGASDGSA
jgi:dUTPase